MRYSTGLYGRSYFILCCKIWLGAKERSIIEMYQPGYSGPDMVAYLQYSVPSDENGPWTNSCVHRRTHLVK